MSLVFFPNNKATQDRIASIKASFRAAAQWTGETPSDAASAAVVMIKPVSPEEDYVPKKAAQQRRGS